MGLFKWGLKKGDAVRLEDGTPGRFVEHKPDGHVVVRVRDRQGNPKLVSKFGGKVRRR